MSKPIFLNTVLSAASLLALAGTGIGCTKGSNSNTASAQTAAMADKGVGPISDLKIEGIDAGTAAKGKAAFQEKCSACHKIDEKYVGPVLRGITLRRRPEWIMNMILNPAEMTQKDPIAQDLLSQYLTQMSFQNVTTDEAREILEFFRQNDVSTK
jgi:mono/diheme cytochrome c family protein